MVLVLMRFLESRVEHLPEIAVLPPRGLQVEQQILGLEPELIEGLFE